MIVSPLFEGGRAVRDGIPTACQVLHCRHLVPIDWFIRSAFDSIFENKTATETFRHLLDGLVVPASRFTLDLEGGGCVARCQYATDAHQPSDGTLSKPIGAVPDCGSHPFFKYPFGPKFRLLGDHRLPHHIHGPHRNGLNDVVEMDQQAGLQCVDVPNLDLCGILCHRIVNARFQQTCYV